MGLQSTIESRWLLSIIPSLMLPLSCSTPMTPAEEARNQDFSVVWDSAFAREVGDVPAVAVFGGVIHKASSIEDACDQVTRQNPQPLHAYVMDRQAFKLGQGVSLDFVIPPGFSESSVDSYVGNDVLKGLVDSASVDPILRVTTLSKNGRTITLPFDSSGQPTITVMLSPASDPTDKSEFKLVLVPTCDTGVLLSTRDASRLSLGTSELPETYLAGSPLPSMILDTAIIRIEVPKLEVHAIVRARRIRVRSK